MPKKKDRSEIEFYRGQVRELSKEIRTLRKQLKQLGRKEHIFDDTIAENQELLAEQEKIEIKKVAKCPKCFEGNLDLAISLDTKDIFTCNSCEFRKVINK